MLKGYADGAGLSVSHGGGVSVGEIHVHAHGVNDPRAMAESMVREIPRALKNRSNKFTPYSS